MIFLSRIILLFSLVFLLSCTDKPTPSLRLGTNIWPGYEPLYLARHKGFLTEDKVHLVEFSSASQVIQAYRNELIDAAALTLDEVLLLLETGESFSIVLVLDISHGGDAIIGQAGIKTFEELRGKRIGVENNALGAYVYTRALEVVGLDKQSVQVIQLDVNEQENAFIQQQVDAVVTFEPTRSKLLKGGGQLLFDSRQIPGEIVDVVIVRNDYLGRHSETVQYLLDGWYQALAFMKEQPRVAAKTLGLRMQLGIDDTLASYQGLKLPGLEENQQLLQQPAPRLLATAQKMEQLMLEQGLLKQNVASILLFSDPRRSSQKSKP